MPLYELMGRSSVEKTLLRVNTSYRLASRLGDDVSIAYLPGENPNDFVPETTSLLNTYCSLSWMDKVKCAQFASQYQTCFTKISVWNSNPYYAPSEAVICIKTLRKDLQTAINAGAPKPTTPTPTPTTEAPGIPTWGWVLIAVGAVAVAGTAVAVIA